MLAPVKSQTRTTALTAFVLIALVFVSTTIAITLLTTIARQVGVLDKSAYEPGYYQYTLAMDAGQAAVGAAISAIFAIPVFWVKRRELVLFIAGALPFFLITVLYAVTQHRLEPSTLCVGLISGVVAMFAGRGYEAATERFEAFLDHKLF